MRQYIYNFLKLSIILSLLLFLTSGCGVDVSKKDKGKTPVVQEQVEQNNNNTFDDANISGDLTIDEADNDQNYQQSGFEYINSLRSATGMVEFTLRDELTTSSQNHSTYLVQNNEVGHSEVEGRISFTGVNSEIRIRNTLSYAYESIGENVSSGDDTVFKSIDNLFSAIYHRFGFLSFNFRDIGLARDSSDDYVYKRAYTYNMASPDRSVMQNKNPKVVLWPYENQQNSVPVFFEESPDPLPDCGVSGYPVSISFNPSKNGDIQMQSFKIFDENGAEIVNTRVLKEDNDPNADITDKQFVLFPLQRLDWGKNYSTIFSYTEGGGAVQNVSWDFKTKDLPTPNYRVTTNNESFSVQSGQTVYFYLPPTNCNDTFNTINMLYDGSISSIQRSLYDGNTIKINVLGSGRVDINTSNGRNFIVNVTN
jgi:uncharacterized protein YkwD